MDRIAWAIGRDPLDVRYANLYAPGRNLTPYGMEVEETDTLLDARADARADVAITARAATRSRRSMRRSPILKRGIALTPVKFGISFTLTHLNQAGALVHVYQDGSVHLNHGGTEMGQGLYIKVAQVVAEEFGIAHRARAHHRDDHRARCRTPRRRRPRPAPISTAWRRVSPRARSSARMTAYAAETLRRARRRGRVPRRPGLHRQREPVLRRAREEMRRSRASSSRRPASTRRRRSPGIAPSATGRPFFYFAYGAACSEVVVDTLTGENRVHARRHPARCRALAQSGHRYRPDRGRFRAGHGLAHDRGAGLRRRGPAAARMRPRPTRSRSPPTCRRISASRFIRTPIREDTIYRSKAVGEPPLMLANSVFCALADAVHALDPSKPVPLDAPATPEAILRACEARAREARCRRERLAAPRRDRRGARRRRARQRPRREGLGPARGGRAHGRAPRRRLSRHHRRRAARMEMLAIAREVLGERAPAARFVDQALGPDLGQCCGGRVTMLIETFVDARSVQARSPSRRRKRRASSRSSAVSKTGACGARWRPRSAMTIGTQWRETHGGKPAPTRSVSSAPGHVGRALVLALAPLPFAVRWIDAREDAFPPHIPAEYRSPSRAEDPAADDRGSCIRTRSCSS